MSIQLVKIDKALLKGKYPSLKPTPGTWICGGAIRQWFVGNEKPSDIDVFGIDTNTMQNFIDTQLKDCLLVRENKYTSTFDYKGQWVQVVKGLPFASIEATLDNFDFTVCQFAWDGTDVFSTPNAIISVLRGHLSSHIIKPEFSADSLRRAFKYQRKGYIPCAGTLKDLGIAFTGLTPGQVTDQVEISPGGGRRTIGID